MSIVRTTKSSNMSYFISILLVVGLSGSFATVQYDYHGIKTEYYNMISDQRVQVSSFVTAADKRISNETNEYIHEIEALEKNIISELQRLELDQVYERLVQEHFQDYLSRIVREPRKIADAIFDIETKWKKHVADKLEPAVDILVTSQGSLSPMYCWTDAKVKIAKNFDFFWRSTKSAIGLTQDVSNSRIEEDATEIRTKLKSIIFEISYCKDEFCLKSYVSH